MRVVSSRGASFNGVMQLVEAEEKLELVAVVVVVEYPFASCTSRNPFE